MHLSLRLTPVLWLLALVAPAEAGSSLQVLSMTPARHAVAASTASPIRLAFDAPLEVSTVHDGNIQVFGTWSGVTDLRFTLLPGDQVLLLTPRDPFFPGEQVTLSVSLGLQGSQGESLPPGGFSAQFWTTPVATGLGFTQAKVLSTREPGEGFIRSYGIYTGDLDDDGAPDYVIPNEVANDVRVLLDDGCANPGPMTKNPVTDFSSPSENVAQDFNGDQRMDFATAGWSADVVEVLLGDGLGGFGAPLSATTGDQPRGLGVLDVDGDGDHDLVTANRSSSDMSLLINDGSGSFSLSGTFDGGGTGETSVAPSDVDNDGTWDLLVAHFASSDVSVLSGDGTGTFVLSDLDGVGQQPWMVAAGDLDGDGFVDAATTDSGSASASVLLNDGLGALDPGSTLPIGNFSVAIDLGDLDGDGDLDLVTSSFSSQKWVGYANDGAGNFTNAFELDAKMSGSCATLVDYDRDGTLDIVGMDELADEMTFWRKTTPVSLGVQPDTCRGTLRIDNKAHAAGFGSHPPQSIGLGDSFHVGVTAAPSRTFAILGGSPSPLGIFTASGILNLQAGWGILMVRTTDDRGEFSQQFNVPTDLPIGLDVGLQVLVDDPSGFVLTNPHVLRLTP